MVQYTLLSVGLRAAVKYVGSGQFFRIAQVSGSQADIYTKYSICIQLLIH